MLTWLDPESTRGQAVGKENGMLVKEVVLLTRANSVITLGRSEICTLAWTPSASVKRG